MKSPQRYLPLIAATLLSALATPPARSAEYLESRRRILVRYADLTGTPGEMASGASVDVRLRVSNDFRHCAVIGPRGLHYPCRVERERIPRVGSVGGGELASFNISRMVLIALTVDAINAAMLDGETTDPTNAFGAQDLLASISRSGPACVMSTATTEMVIEGRRSLDMNAGAYRHCELEEGPRSLHVRFLAVDDTPWRSTEESRITADGGLIDEAADSLADLSGRPETGLGPAVDTETRERTTEPEAAEPTETEADEDTGTEAGDEPASSSLAI